MILVDMEMPRRCAECKICVNQKTNDYGTYGKCLLQDKNVNCLVYSRDKDCPLIESEVEERKKTDDSIKVGDEVISEYNIKSVVFKNDDFDNLDSMLEDLWNATESEDKE